MRTLEIILLTVMLTGCAGLNISFVGVVSYNAAAIANAGVVHGVEEAPAPIKRGKGL